ncbi:MAG: hypothetical protein P8N76_06390 [Pirellulaceae bacterium]|nr:hypothetical protein [Pirellulaceae bacterium]
MPSRIITFLLFVGFGLIPMEICASILTGNMWVMDNATGNEDGRILTITPAGEAAVAITAAEIDAARTAANDEFPEGMGVRFTDNDIVFDNYGNFYFTENVSDGLFRLNEKTGLVQLVKESDILALTQNDDPNLYKAKPEKLAAGSGNMLYVTEKESGSILAVDRVTGSVSVLVSQTDFTNSLAVEEIKLSGGIALSPDETRLYVVNDFGDDSLIKVDISGQTPVITELVS